LVGVIVGGTAFSAVASGAAGPPINDNYLGSLELNQKGTKLDRIHTLQDLRNTAAATVQSNIFSPCGLASCPSGPAEVTACNGVNYGNTVWYDFYPDAAGQASIRTSGFDNVITLYTFNPSTLAPNVSSRHCVHQGTFLSEQLLAPVKKGVAYTFQIGGVDAAIGTGTGGPLEMQFDYSVPRPGQLKADATLTARATATGISIISLIVTAPHRGARVEVDCPHHCSSKTRTVPKHGSTALSFGSLAGLSLPAGAQVVIRVSAPNMIGAAIEYNILAGNLNKNQFCMQPGSRKLRRPSQCH
jgi:hypothetical protein